MELIVVNSVDEIVRLDKDHLIVDCCPRNGERETPCQGVKIEYEQDGLFIGARTRYTLYINVQIALGNSVRRGYLDVTCHKCKTVYRMEKRFLRELKDQTIKFRDKRGVSDDFK
ncbi:hypothetical protein ACFL0X_00870 [Nanoarchaeota archaeon]